MTTLELEAYKAELAREILTTDSRAVLDAVKRLLKRMNKQTLQTDDPDTISKEEILAGIDAGLKEVKLAMEGKVKAKSLQELINEL